MAKADQRQIRDVLMTIGGLVALLTPLFLWVAWSQRLFWLVIATGCAAIVIIYCDIWMSPDRDA